MRDLMLRGCLGMIVIMSLLGLYACQKSEQGIKNPVESTTMEETDKKMKTSNPSTDTTRCYLGTDDAANGEAFLYTLHYPSACPMYLGASGSGSSLAIVTLRYPVVYGLLPKWNCNVTFGRSVETIDPEITYTRTGDIQIQCYTYRTPAQVWLTWVPWK